MNSRNVEAKQKSMQGRKDGREDGCDGERSYLLRPPLVVQSCSVERTALLDRLAT